jgi:hypothetical protein
LKEKDRSLLSETEFFYSLKNRVRNVFFKKRFLTRLRHNPQSFKINSGLVTQPNHQLDDNLLIDRLKDFYLICDANFEGNKNSVWSGIFRKMQGDIHSAFINDDNDKIVDILRNPRKYNLFYGFENLNRDLIRNKRLEDVLEPEMAMDTLISTCEAVGITNIPNPESLKICTSIDPGVAIELLENEFGFDLNFPNPFEGEFGIKTKRGIISYRAMQAVYQAWRISTTVKEISNPRVLEIGGGLGRTAYYCRQFGITDYTIVDIPMSSLAQGNFLGRVLSGDNLILGSESDNEDQYDKIKLLYPKCFFSSNKKYDLIVNFDSLTELDINLAKEYLEKIGKVGNLFLSVNHEINPFSVNTIWKENPYFKKLYRSLSWVRQGYVDELFVTTKH